MTVSLATEVKRLVTEGLSAWIEEEPELGRRLRETLGEIPRQPFRQDFGELSRAAHGRLPQRMTYEEFLC